MIIIIKLCFNPDYNTIYKELTYQTLTSDDYKINILCEDDVAKKIITSILSKKSLTSTINFISNISGRTGTSCNSLLALVRNGKNLLSDSIVIVDPDVNINRTNINGFNDLLKIPDSNELPVEKRVLYFIYNLDRRG